MHDHRTGRWPEHVAPWGSLEYEHQRRLLLELAVSPPPGGDDADALARSLGVSSAALDAAAEALIAAGLAERDEGRLLASRATVALEALWPIGL